MDANARRQVQLGKRLAAQKKACFAAGQTWTSHVQQNCGFSRRRADELIQIGTGVVSVQEARGRKKRSQSKTRTMRQDASAELIDRNYQLTQLVEQRVRKRLEVDSLSEDAIDAIRASAMRHIEIWRRLVETL